MYAASEGLSTVIVEREAPGGQAGQSASIENYLGFPKGLTGSDLTHRAVAQAIRFGAEMVLARDVIGFQTRGLVHAVLLDGSGEIEARALIVATGVSYRRLEAAGLDELTGRGVYYGVTASEASQCQDDDVFVVGAANSAGQAALNLARFAKRVVLVVRAAKLTDTMSQYLVDRITSAPNIEVRYRSLVSACRGDGHLEALTLTRQGLRRQRGAAIELAVRLHRSLAPNRVARPRRRPRRQGIRGDRERSAEHRLCPDLAAATGAVRSGDKRARGVRGRRRTTRLHETGRVGRR